MPNTDYSQLYSQNGTQTKQAPPPAQYTAPPNPAPPIPQARPVQPKKPFSPIPLMLIAGVTFLFLGGIIFLTGTWSMLPDVARALCLLSASVVAFGINVLAERVLKLPKTGLAFYILGCIFLPLALGGIGQFALLGNWFSFHGDGGALLAAVICLSVSATSFLGQSNYKSSFLAWLGLAGLSGTWGSLCTFLADLLEKNDVSYLLISSLSCALLTIFAVGCACISEAFLRKNADNTTPLSKAWIPFLFVQNAVYAIILLVCGMDAHAAGFICCTVIALLFLNERFLFKGVHWGVFGFALSWIFALIAICNAPLFQTASLSEVISFVTAATVFMLFCISVVPKFHAATRKTMRFTGMILSIPTVIFTFFAMLFNLDHGGSYYLFLFAPLLIAAIHFSFAPKNPLAEDAPHFVLTSILLFSLCMSLTENTMMLRLLLIVSTLLLLIQAYFSRRIWCLALSICTCLALLLMGLPHGAIWITWLCAAALFIALVYAHHTRRPLLERSSAWAGLPFLMTAVCHTLLLFMEQEQAWILTLAVPALVYLAESTLLRSHIHSAGMRAFCTDLAALQCVISIIALNTNELNAGWLLLFALSTAVLGAGALRRLNNFVALPILFSLFVILQEIILLCKQFPALGEMQVLGLQLGGYLLMLLAFAGMGRLLLPNGFFCKEMNRFQVDWGLVAAAFPIFSASVVIDWYPSIICCLLLSVYSLFYIGRVKRRYLPALLASAFGCLTIFFHNVNDPFRLFELWYDADFKSPQILLYLLPMHLFIFLLRFILPQKFHASVHTARFCMYCFTMLCILVASLSFNRAEDGIILAGFSLFILIGSFFVKRLRWFTLGFSVLTLMTIKLTWEFWRSLHWGIYLFLAGAILIGIAFYYEYGIRRANEKSSEPKEKVALFKEWRW